jgi:hypothetical protein
VTLTFLWIGSYSAGVTEIEKKAAALLTITGFAFEYITTAIEQKHMKSLRNSSFQTSKQAFSTYM